MTAPIGIFMMLLVFVFFIGAATGAIVLSLWWVQHVHEPKNARMILKEAHARARDGGFFCGTCVEGEIVCPCCGYTEHPLEVVVPPGEEP